MPGDKPGSWRIDWFDAHEKVFVPYFSNHMGRDMVDAELAVDCFMDNLLGGDSALAEAMLSARLEEARISQRQPSDADLGYNRRLVLQKLHGWKGDYPHYGIAKRREVSAGETARFEVGGA